MATFDAHKNFAYSTVATAPVTPTAGTSLVVAAGDGTKFPAVSFNAIVWPVGQQPLTTNCEIVRVTAISTDTFTITRTEESSSSRSIIVGDQIAAAETAKTFTDIEALLDQAVKTTSTPQFSGIGVAVAGVANKLMMPTGGIVDFGAANVTMTHTSGVLSIVAGLTTVSGAFGIAISPAFALDVAAGDNTTLFRAVISATQANITAADHYIDFTDNVGAVIGSIAGTAVAGVVAYNTFTGAHYSQADTIDKREVDAISHQPRLRDVVVKGKKGAFTITKEKYFEDVPTKIYQSDLPAGMVLVSTAELAVWEGEPNSVLPKCAVSTKKEDKAVYGVYGGHDRNGDISVLALGSGIILVTDEGGKIEIGDFLCTSSTPGYAMRYDGSDMRVVVAKARQNFTGDQGSIACTYLAG
jgi:hypothetical protein